jgi:hypothetical protein
MCMCGQNYFLLPLEPLEECDDQLHTSGGIHICMWTLNRNILQDPTIHGLSIGISRRIRPFTASQ